MDTKRWFQSKTIWGAIVAFVASGLRLLGIDVTDLASPQLVDQILNVVSLVGTLVAIYGRIRASKFIAPKNATLPPGTHITPAIIAALLIPAFLFTTSCAQGPVYTSSAAAHVATDVELAAVQAMQAYADYKSGNADMLWALSKGVGAYQQIIQDASDVKLLAKAWTGNTGDSQKLADRLARIFAQSTAPPAQKAAAIATAAIAVASNSAP